MVIDHGILSGRPILTHKRQRNQQQQQQEPFYACTIIHNENRINSASNDCTMMSTVPSITDDIPCYATKHDNICVSVAYATQASQIGHRPARKVKRKLYPEQTTWSLRMFSVVTLTVLLIVFVGASNPTFTLCYTQLIRADANGDKIIDSTTAEWGMVVQYLSGGTATSEALDAAVLLAVAGSTDAITLNIATVQDPSNNHAFCRALYTAIIGAASTRLDISESKCFYAATIGDANRDSLLERLTEYPRYANQVSGNVYGFGTTYEELPLPVQSIFDEFVDDTAAGTINIVGSKSSETVTTEQATKLNLLCQSAAIAILAANGDLTTGSPPITAPVSIPVSIPAVPISVAPILSPAPMAEVTQPTPVAGTVNVPDNYVESYTYTACLQKIAFSDSSRDNTLNKDEYYDFLNRITTDAFVGYTSFDSLPDIARNNFISLAGGTADGTINVMGSKPGQTPTQEDTDRLNEFCTLTDIAIQGSGHGGGSGASASPPVAAPVVDAVNVPVTSAISYDNCVKSMIVADISRNSLLDGKEFVRFVSRLNTNVAKATDELSSLPLSIQNVFTALATSNGEIDVTGSKPNEEPTPEQKVHLEDICNQLGIALFEVSNVPNTAPTPASSGSVTIYNSFITANKVQITAKALKSGQLDWEGLSNAYKSFVEGSATDVIVNRVLGVRNLERGVSSGYHLRQRLLPVSGVVQDSAQLGQINDIPCPTDVAANNTLCQVVFASFGANYIDMNESFVLTSLTNHTQSAINPKLNETLLSINPNSAIHIIGPSEIVKPPENTMNTTTNPTTQTIIEGDNEEGPNIVQIIGALVIFGILFGGPIYYWQSRRTKKKPHTIADMNKEDLDVVVDDIDGMERAPSFRVKNTCTDDDESDDEDPGNDDTDSSANEDNTPNKTEQNGKSGGKKFNAFRLGKKKGSSSDDEIGILDSNDGLGIGIDDFDNYEFDEPCELFVDQHIDNDWGDAEWGTAINDITKNTTDFVAHNPNPDINDNEEGNEHTEWSRSQSSGSNSAFGTSSVKSGASGDNVAQLGGLVDKGQWGGVLQTASQFHNNLNDSLSSRNSDRQSLTSNKSNTETSNYDDYPVETIDDPSDDQTPMTNKSFTSEEIRRAEMYRMQIEDLVRKTAPDEISNVKSMMEKFIGREAELINTLQTMHERLVSHRALKAVHKSKAIRARDMRDFASGGAESSAVIAAACMINGEEGENDYNDGEFDDEGEESYYDHDEREENASGSGSYSDRSRSVSYDENEYEDGQSGRYDHHDEYDEDRSGSYNDDEYEDDHTGSHDDDSYEDGHSGTYDNDVQDDNQGNYTDDDNEHSQYDDENEDRSRYDNENDDLEDGSRGSAYDDDDQSYYSRDHRDPTRQISNDDDDYDEDDAFKNEGELFDNDEEFEDDFAGSRSGSGSNSGSYIVGGGHSADSRTEGGSKSQSQNFVYDDGDGSYYSNEE